MIDLEYVLHIVSYRIVSYRIVSYRIVSHRIVSHRIVSYRIVSCLFTNQCNSGKDSLCHFTSHPKFSLWSLPINYNFLTFPDFVSPQLLSRLVDVQYSSREFLSHDTFITILTHIDFFDFFDTSSLLPSIDRRW